MAPNYGFRAYDSYGINVILYHLIVFTSRFANYAVICNDAIIADHNIVIDSRIITNSYVSPQLYGGCYIYVPVCEFQNSTPQFPVLADGQVLPKMLCLILSVAEGRGALVNHGELMGPSCLTIRQTIA